MFGGQFEMQLSICHLGDNLGDMLFVSKIRRQFERQLGKLGDNAEDNNCSKDDLADDSHLGDNHSGDKFLRDQFGREMSTRHLAHITCLPLPCMPAKKTCSLAETCPLRQSQQCAALLN